MQPVAYPTNNCHDHIEDNAVREERTFNREQAKLPVTGHRNCEEISNSRCNNFTSDMMPSFTQSEVFDDECNFISSSVRDNSMIYFEDSSTFSDTLSNYF